MRVSNETTPPRNICWGIMGKGKWTDREMRTFVGSFSGVGRRNLWKWLPQWRKDPLMAHCAWMLQPLDLSLKVQLSASPRLILITQNSWLSAWNVCACLRTTFIVFYPCCVSSGSDSVYGSICLVFMISFMIFGHHWNRPIVPAQFKIRYI